MKWSAGKYSPLDFARLMASVIVRGGGSSGSLGLWGGSFSESEEEEEGGEREGDRDGAGEVAEVCDWAGDAWRGGGACSAGEREGERVTETVEGVVSRKGPSILLFLPPWKTKLSSEDIYIYNLLLVREFLFHQRSLRLILFSSFCFWDSLTSPQALDIC